MLEDDARAILAQANSLYEETGQLVVSASRALNACSSNTVVAQHLVSMNVTIGTVRHHLSLLEQAIERAAGKVHDAG